MHLRATESDAAISTQLGLGGVNGPDPHRPVVSRGLRRLYGQIDRGHGSRPMSALSQKRKSPGFGATQRVAGPVKTYFWKGLRRAPNMARTWSVLPTISGETDFSRPWGRSHVTPHISARYRRSGVARRTELSIVRCRGRHNCPRWQSQNSASLPRRSRRSWGLRALLLHQKCQR